MASHDLLAIPGFADPFSSMSHLLAAGVFAFLAAPLIRKGIRSGQPAWGVASLTVFAFAAVFLLSMSGVYHLLTRGGPARDIVQRLDHAAIFLLIAGTFTPIHAILFRGPWRWAMLAFVWTLAALGITLKSIFFVATPEWLGMVLYLGMGWVGLLSMMAIARRYGMRMVFPLALGGLTYTAGAAIDWAQPRPLLAGVIRAHEIFHIAVIVGLALHWRLIWSIAGMKPAGAKEPLFHQRFSPDNIIHPGGAEPAPTTPEIAITVPGVRHPVP